MIDEIMKARPYIRRAVYSERIKPYIGKQIIKVLSGQRRVGKSYILFQLIDDIKKDVPDANIIYVNKELKAFEFIKTENDLYLFVQKSLKKQRSNFLFVDEIQEIENFELAFRSLLAENTCDLFCTGSNAKLLSGELATALAGRYIEFAIHSLGYDEFLHFMQIEAGNEALVQYLNLGGMPYINVIGLNEASVFEYLRNVYASILLKDVVARENIRNVSFLENLIEFLADNVGSLFSANNISKYLKSQRSTVTPQTVLNYIKPLINAYFIHKIQRYDLSGLKIFETSEKYYFEDLGLRNAIRGFDRRKDIQKLIENAVYLHLIQQGFEVFVGQFGVYEIDFVARRKGKRVYVQVSYLLTDENTIIREFGNLIKIADNYPKFVVTMDELNTGTDYKGITQIHLGDFLLHRL
jgi:predicted AAA+ superfamily ATPase